MKIIKKLTLLFALTLLTVSIIPVLSSCKANNQFTNDQSQTCEHQWIEADCLYPKTCRICSQTQGQSLGHQFNDATCTEPKTCQSCNLVEGDALGHSWAAATCEKAKTCSVCAITEGLPLTEHNYQNGKCVICNQSEPLARVYGQLTYQYNEFIGTRGDNGATVMLIPYNDEVKNYDNHKAAMLLSGKYDSGIIVEECDGYGNFDFGNSVSAGKYILVAISNETTSGQRFDDEEFWKFLVDGAFGNLFSDKDRESLYTFIGYSDWTFEILTIEPNDDIRFTHDFGYTYI